jgi:hypothetical protein
MTTHLAINESLTELKNSLALDLQMVRNYRSVLVKTQELERVDSLREIERCIEQLVSAVEKGLPK